MKQNMFKLAILSAIVLAGLGITTYAQNSADRQDQANAKALLLSMSTYLGSQQKLSFDFDSQLELTTDEDQKLSVASSGTLTLDRNKGLRAARKGGFADVEMFFDGTSVTLLDKETNNYAQVQFTGSAEALIDELRHNRGKQIPAADLLRANFYEVIMSGVTDVKDLGSGFIRGQECDHIALRTYDVDVEIWIAQGARPYPCRIKFVSKQIKLAPHYTVDVIGFQAGASVKDVDFKFVSPQGAKQVEPSELANFDELPEHLKGQK